MKCLRVVVQYFEKEAYTMQVKLIDILNVYENDTIGSTGENCKLFE